MSPDDRPALTPGRRGLLTGTLLVLCATVLASPPAFGMEREVRTRIANYDEAPVIVRQAAVYLVQSYGNPTSAPVVASGDNSPSTRHNRVRYMNRLNQEIPRYQLESELHLQNLTPKEIEAFQVTMIFLNAFHERIASDQQSVTEPLGPREMKTVEWSRKLPHQEVFELFLVITAVRFQDGSVWVPVEELIIVP